MCAMPCAERAREPLSTAMASPSCDAALRGTRWWVSFPPPKRGGGKSHQPTSADPKRASAESSAVSSHLRRYYYQLFRPVWICAHVEGTVTQKTLGIGVGGCSCAASRDL